MNGTWESLAADYMERHFGRTTVCKVEDPVRRNRYAAHDRWLKRHPTYESDYYHANREKRKAEATKWKREHPEAVREHARRYREKRKNDPAYREYQRQKNREYRQRLKLKKESEKNVNG